MIQQALDDEIFPRIASATTSKMTWDTLKQEYLGGKKVITVKLQSLRREFETALMTDKESVQEYLSRVSTVVQQMRSYGETMTNEHVVGKVLRSLTNKYDHVVAAIEESKDMADYTFDELMGSLQAHEERLNRNGEKKEEKAFHVKGESSNKEKTGQFSGRGRGRAGSRGRVRGRGQNKEGKEQSYKGPVKCYYCKKPGHKEASCWKKEEDEQKGDQKSNFVENEQKLFLAQRAADNDAGGDVWYIDSGCSNHMSSAKSMFRELNESLKSKVRLGDEKQLEVEGRGMIAIKTEQGNTKLLYDVQYVPNLAHYLLSVGQLLNSGYSVLFENDFCLICDKKSKEVVVKIVMGRNRMFPLDLSGNVSKALTVKGDDDGVRIYIL
ncbi:Retrovirus-related Pol polyprotein from transposon TNT 1-94 [Glycine max]|nr:Retrovirus-related Pol polyprotein from transposon TNT 1-94 [Glycine max]